MYKLQLFSVLFHNNHICYHATSPLAFPACARTCVWNRLALGPTDVCVLCSSPCWLHVSETGAAVQKYCKSLSERKLFICSFMLFKICFYVIAQRTLLSFISCTLKKEKKELHWVVQNWNQYVCLQVSFLSNWYESWAPARLMPLQCCVFCLRFASEISGFFLFQSESSGLGATELPLSVPV